MSNISGFTNTKKINQQAAEWILLIEDTPELSAEQITALNDWVSLSDVHRQCLTDMANSWGEMSILAHVMAPKEVQVRSPKSILQAWLLTPVIAFLYLCSNIIGKRNLLLRPLVAVPMAIVLVAGVTLLTLNPNSPISLNSQLITQVGQHSSHILSDGSKVWLNSNSQVRVSYNHNVRRVDLIKGEAHFEVQKDPSRPFEVYADDRVVRAIGTAFSVYKVADRIEVLVSEGKVELAVVDSTLVIKPDDFEPVKIGDVKPLENANGEVIRAGHSQFLTQLVAGQRVSIPTGEPSNIKQISEDIVELDTSEVTRKLSWREGKLIFAGESLEEVVAEISRHTSVQIELTDPSLRTMRIGGQFQAGETDKLFYVLESGFGIGVDKIDKDHVQLKLKD